jgi:hypothetical protein
MSDRCKLFEIRSSAVKGNAINVFRDNDTRTYRLFACKGLVVRNGGYSFDDCECCDLSVEDLRVLYVGIGKALGDHEPWL